MTDATPILFANALGWRSQAALVERTASNLYPGQRFPLHGYRLPKLARPLLKDIYGLSFPRRLNLITSVDVTASFLFRDMLKSKLEGKVILMGGSTLGFVSHLSPATAAVIVTDMTSALAVRMFGARYSARDIALERKLFHRCRKVFAMSKACIASLVDDYGLPSQRVELFLPPTTIPPLRSRTASEMPVIGFVGSDFERKGGQDLLEVFRESFADKACLVIVSSGSPEGAAGKGVTVYGSLPHSEIVGRILPSLDLFCLPTRQDCSGLAIAEALAQGVPVVTTNIAGVSDLVSDDRTGMLVEPADKESLRQALGKLIADGELRRRYGDEARAFAIENLEVERSTRRLVDALSGDVMASS